MTAVRAASIDELPAYRLGDSVRARALFGDQMMFNVLEFEPHGIIPLHHHPHEQLGLVLEGELLLVSDRRERWLRPGDVYAVPPDAPHEGRAGPTGCRVLDVFHPIREDYRALAERR